MDIETYITAQKISQAEFGERVGVSQGMVSHWISRRKQITPTRAKVIEEATGGAVTRHELRPDIFDAPAAAPVTAEEGAG